MEKLIPDPLPKSLRMTLWDSGTSISAKRKLIVWQVNERGFVVIDPVEQMEISELHETREEAEAELEELCSRRD